MKNWIKRNRINILVACAISIPLSVYGISQLPTVTIPEDTFENDVKTNGIQTETETETSVTIEQVENVTVAEPEPTYTSLGEFKLTAYCSCEICCKQWANLRPKDEYGNDIVLGASGERLEPLRSIAVDTSVIPYGTEIMIYDKIFIAQDIGGSIKGNHIDIYMESHEDACAFGLQYAEVFLVERGSEE